MKMRNRIILILLMLTSTWLMAQERYQHYGTVTSFAGGEVTGVGMESTVVAGEAIIGPFSGGNYEGFAGFLNMNSACEVPMELMASNITSNSVDIEIGRAHV